MDFFGNFGLRDTFQERIASKSIEIDMKKLYMKEEDCVRRILEADVHGQCGRGRQRKRWIDVVSTTWRTCGST